MWLGVPQLILILLAICTLVIGMWSFILIHWFAGFVVLLFGMFAFVVLRFMSAEDPYKLLQRGKQFQSWFYGRWNSGFWGAHSASPLDIDRLRKIRE